MENKGLFSRLLYKRPEDFFTELVAYLFDFDKSNEILFAWLQSLGWQKMAENYQIKVKTQTYLDRLVGQDLDSRLDMCINLYSGEIHDVIFIESKLDSSEHDNQLSRYAEHLAKESAQQKLLLYITKNRDKKVPHEILRVAPGIIFKQGLWRDFYDFLSGHSSQEHFLTAEVKRYMEENGLSKQDFWPKKLTSSNIQDTFELLLHDVFLDREMDSGFSAINSETQFSDTCYLEEWSRAGARGYYAREGNIAAKGGMRCALGFYNPGKIKPQMFVLLQLKPASNQVDPGLREKLQKVLDGLQTRSGWKGETFGNPPNNWVTVVKYQDMPNPLISDEIIKSTLKAFLNELTKSIYSRA